MLVATLAQLSFVSFPYAMYTNDGYGETSVEIGLKADFGQL